MELSRKVYRACSYCIGTGLFLMSVALLLHPMNPEDFLAVALSAPWETIGSAYGIQAAILFWTSAVLIALGLAGLIRYISFFSKRLSPGTRIHQSSVRSSTENMEENWYFL